MENALVLQRDAYEQALAQASLVRDALRVLMDEDVCTYDVLMLSMCIYILLELGIFVSVFLYLLVNSDLTPELDSLMLTSSL